MVIEFIIALESLVCGAVEAKPVSAILAFDTAYNVMLRYDLPATLLA